MDAVYDDDWLISSPLSFLSSRERVTRGYKLLFFPHSLCRMEKIKSKQKPTPAASDRAEPPADPEQTASGAACLHILACKRIVVCVTMGIKSTGNI